MSDQIMTARIVAPINFAASISVRPGGNAQDGASLRRHSETMLMLALNQLVRNVILVSKDTIKKSNHALPFY